MIRIIRGAMRRFDDLPLRIKGIIVIAVPLALLLAALASVFMADRQSRSAEDQVRLTLQIKSDIQEVHALIAESATGVRGYLLTGQESFLAPYRRARLALPSVIDRMSGQIVDEEQRARLERVRSLIEGKLASHDALRQAGALPPDERGDLSNALTESKRHLDLVRAEINAMAQREEDLLRSRSEAAERARDLSRTLTVGAGFLGFLGALTAILMFSTGIVRRMHRLEKQAHRLSRGEAVAVESTIDDEIGDLEKALELASVLLKKREADLKESEERFRLLVEGVCDYGIFALDPDGKVVSWNTGAERMTGYTAGEIIGQNFASFYPPETRDSAPARKLSEAAANGRAEEEGWRIRKNGTRFWTHAVVSALYDDTGHLRGFSKIARDVTERKRFEEALLAAREDAVRANNAKSEFLSRMSHELRTPLNSILGFAQLLELDVADEDSRASVAQILRAGRHLLSLIDEVLDIARIEAGRMDLVVEPQPVGEIIAEAISLAGPLCSKSQTRIIVEEPAETAVTVLADRRRLLQVLLNLLSNAVKYNHHGGTVVIGHYARESCVRIDISDDGPGIPHERIGRLFTPFDRLGAERAGEEGTGLGLALSKQLVEAMRGTLSFQNRPEGGAIFCCELPRGRPLLAPAKAPNLATSTKRAKAEQKLILYVEDTLASLALVEKLIERRSERLLPSMQGRLGLSLALEHRPDLVLLDLDLPDISGWDVLRQLRADPRTQTIPVVIVSADVRSEVRDSARREGAAGHLTKPLDIDQFMATLDEVLGA